MRSPPATIPQQILRGHSISYVSFCCNWGTLLPMQEITGKYTSLGQWGKPVSLCPMVNSEGAHSWLQPLSAIKELSHLYNKLLVNVCLLGTWDRLAELGPWLAFLHNLGILLESSSPSPSGSRCRINLEATARLIENLSLGRPLLLT